MKFYRSISALLFLLFSVSLYGQLGFCGGSKGEPIFSETFGNGSTYGPALPAGTTTYPFVTGAPNDGQYTIFYHSNLYSTWHYSLDHTPDATDGPNGKMLLMNANATTSGDFYKKTVSGLCVNTTFEFSAWLMNVYNPNTNYCGAGQIPINVRFEIWDSTETILLGSGNTGNIMGSPAPLWQQFALVFTTVNETSVVLKMKNNGLGGCGNDLAIDDITFSACGDLTTVSSPSVAGDTYSSCVTPASLELHASTAGGAAYFYQWQTSTDGVNWTDVAGATNAVYITPSLSSLTYYRVKAAQDAANLSNNFCSTLSNVFTIDLLPAPAPALSNGDAVICSDEAIPALSVNNAAGTGVNWYSAASGGSLLQSGSATFTPTGPGIFYAETYNTTTNCVGSPRTAVELSIIPLPDAQINASASICSGNTATVNFTGTPNAVVTYTADGGASQNIALDASGNASITTPVLSSNSTYTLISCSSPALASCSRALSDSATIVVNSVATASISGDAQVCSGGSAVVSFTGTPNAVVTYAINGGANQTIALDSSGAATVTAQNLTTTTTYALVEVSVAGATGCTQTLSQSITLSVVALPTATVSVNPATICSGQTTTVNFSGTPNAVVTYKVNGGANQTVNLNASGSASINSAALSSNTTYTLVSAVNPGLGSCPNSLNASATVTVSALPTASATTNAPVCNGAAATVSFTGTPNATLSYTVDSGAVQSILLNAAGNASISVPNVTSTSTYSLVDVVSATPNSCIRPLSQSVTVSAIPLPTAAISVSPATLCSGQTAVLTFNGTPDALVSYSSNGGTAQQITLDASGSASVVTAAISANTNFQLLNVSLPGTGCSQTATGNASVSVNPTPNVLYSGSLQYCDGDAVSIQLSSAVAGTTFSWTVSENGTTGAAAGSGNQISQTPSLQTDAPGTITYVITPVANGCSGTPVSIVVSLQPLPVPAITDGVICTNNGGPASSQPYLLDTQLSASGHSFQWFFEGNPITGATGNTFSATQTGTYGVIATNAAGCVSSLVTAVVGQMPTGESLVIHHSATFSDHPSITVDVTGGGGPFSYQLDDLPFQSSNVFTPVAPGTHTITVIDDFCTYLTETVTIIDYPRYFTPNGDGFHDTWDIEGVSYAEILIFDRYGKLIKQLLPGGMGWDGSYNGRPLPSTDYWFTIDYLENGSDRTFRAHFSLKR